MSLADQIENLGHALTAQELAKLLQVNPDTIWKMAKQSRIPSFRVGSAVRFDPKNVADWLRQV